MTNQSQSEQMVIGKILKPRGLSGEVKVQILTNKPEAFHNVTNIEKISFSGEFAYLKFKDINSAEAAENLRGQLIKIPRDLLPLDNDEIIADDLIGFKVVGEDGRIWGTVRKVESVGASEVLDCGTFMFPYEDAFVVETNMTKRQIIIKAEMLDEEIIL